MANPTPADPRSYDYAQAVVETIREPLVVLSPDLRVLRANRSFCRTFQVTPEQLENQLLCEWGSGQWDTPPLRELLGAVLADDRPFHGFELTGEFEHLGRRTMLLSAQQLPVHDQPQAILLTMEDITERRRVEAALAVSEVRYRRLFEAAQDGILLVDAHSGEIVDANPFLEDLLRYSHGEMVGRRLWEMGPFRDLQASRLAFQELQHRKYIRYEDLPLETKQGNRINVEFVSNVYDVDGAAIIQCNIRDITKRRRAEEELHALRLDLEARVQARTAELARANLALQREIVERERAEARERNVVVEERTRIAREIHDTLAQGFTGIVIQLEAAEDALVAEPDAVLTHLLRARTLARESLAGARRSVWALRPLDQEADDLGYAFVHLVDKLTQESGTRIGFTLEGIPRPMGQDVEHHLLRIGQEAVTNALRHAQTTQISVTLACHEDHVELSIEDRGQGFDPTSPAYQRGLGLRGMWERAGLVGGQLAVTSLPGQGTRVGVVVPARHPEGVALGEDRSDHGSHCG